MLELDFASCVVGSFITAVMVVLFALVNMISQRARYYYNHRILKEKLIQRLERKNDDINN